MIEKIKIRNYRSITTQDFNNLGRMKVFIGKNNSGKSTVLNALRVFNNSYPLSINDIHHRKDFFEIGIVKDLNYILNKFDTFLQLDEVLNQEFLKFYHINVNRKGRQETRVYWLELARFVKDKYLNGENLIKVGLILNVDKKLKKSYRLVNANFTKIYQDNLSDSHIIVKSFKNHIANIEDERKFHEEVSGSKQSISNSVFTLFLESLKSRDQTSDLGVIKDKKAEELSILEINQLMNHRIDEQTKIFLKDMEARFKKNTEMNLSIFWDSNNELNTRVNFESKFIDEQNNQVDFLSTGSGTRSMYMLSLLETYIENIYEDSKEHGLFLIEEPELYLYPKLEDKMGEILNKLAKKNQVFITTHSSNLVNYLPESSIVFVELSEVTSVNQVPKSKFSEGVDSGKIMEQLGFNAYPFINKKYVILVEGKDDEKFYGSIIKNHYPECYAQTIILSVGGVENVRFGVTSSFIKDSNFKNNFMIIVDSDGRSKKKLEDKYFEVLRKVFDFQEAKYIFNNKFYATENATCIETMSFHPTKILNEDDLIEYYGKCQKFIDENDNQIIETIDKKLNLKLITEHERDYIKKTLFGKEDIVSKYNILREKVLTDGLLKIFNQSVGKHNLLCEYDISIQKEIIPDLLQKLNDFYSTCE